MGQDGRLGLGQKICTRLGKLWVWLKNNPLKQSGVAQWWRAQAEQSKKKREEAIRLAAYYLWEADKKPEGMNEYYWHKAREKIDYLSRFRKWTGIGEKKGWDFLQLGIGVSIPILLFFGTQYFSTQQQKIATERYHQDKEIAAERYRQDVLIKYLEQMSQLLLDKNLREKESEARTIARARTLSALRELDSFRKGLLIQFLAEAKLIAQEQRVISLVDADLTFADLRGARLSGADLRGAFLRGADLTSAKLESANLESAILSGADLESAYLSGAILSGAYLIGARLYVANLESAILSGADLTSAFLTSAFLRGADLRGARLSGADLTFANLRGADLTLADLNSAYLIGARLSGANLSFADLNSVDLSFADLSDANLYGAYLIEAKKLTLSQIKSACYWEKAIYEGHWDNRSILQVDEEANQQHIDRLKKDKASEPSEPVDCDIWKTTR